MKTQFPAAVLSELAPTGKLRVGLNFSNFLLTGRDPADGNPRGVAVDLAKELGRRLGLPLEFVAYDSPGAAADGGRAGDWDVTFLAAEPARATEIAFTAAYLEIEATYLVPAGSQLCTIADVDRDGIRISVSNRSAYELFLSRTLQHAQLIRIPGVDESFEQFVFKKLDALAGLRPRLVMDAEKLPGSRVLDGRFTAIQQAIGTPISRCAAALYLGDFVEDVKASGLVGSVIERNGVRGVLVASKAPNR